MPTSNIYYTHSDQRIELQQLAPKLKKLLAEQLTCGDKTLTEDEISVRLIEVDGIGLIGAVEIEIVAYAYPERVKEQDNICLKVRAFVQENYPQLGEVKVWLILAELGHSWE